MITLSGHWLLLVVCLPGICLGAGLIIGRWASKREHYSRGYGDGFEKRTYQP